MGGVVRLGGLTIALLVAVSSAAQTRDKLTPEVIYAKAKGSVVTILTFDSGKAALAQGSGFVVAKNQVVTNYHVLAGSASASIIFSDGSVTPAGPVVAASVPKDLAIVEADTGDRQSLPLGNELQLKVGETVYTIGAPVGLSASFSSGLISAFREDAGQFLIQISAAIAPGSSGGPLLNSQGQVVGVATYRLKDAEFGFAVGIGDVQHLLKAPLGVRIQLSDLFQEETVAPQDELKPVQALFDQKKYTGALTSFQALSDAAKSAFGGQLLLCQIQEELSNYLGAIQACDSAIRLEPKNAAAYAAKALALIMSGEAEQAEAPAVEAVHLSDSAELRNLLAVIYYSNEKYSLAARVVPADSKDPFMLTLLAGAALHTGGTDSFKQLVSELAAQKGTNNGWQLYIDGATAEKDLNFSAALEDYRKCNADSDFIDPVCDIAVASIETRQGNYDSAKSDIDSALLRYPKNHSILSEAIFVNLILGNAAEATRLHQALKTAGYVSNDEFTDCLYYYGVNQAALAAEHCTAAIRGHEENYVAWSNAGYVALDTGQFQSAVSYFVKARDLFYASKEKHTVTQEVDLLWGLTLAAYFSGDKKDARSLYRAIKKTYPTFTTIPALKQLPLVWSDYTQVLINKLTADLK